MPARLSELAGRLNAAALFEDVVVHNWPSFLVLVLGATFFSRTRNPSWFLPSLLLMGWEFHVDVLEGWWHCTSYMGFLVMIVRQSFAVAVLTLPILALLACSRRPARVDASTRRFFYSTLLALATVALDTALLLLFTSPGVDI